MSQREKLADSVQVDEVETSMSPPQLSPSGSFAHPEELWNHSLEDLDNLIIIGDREWVPIGPQPLIIGLPTKVEGVDILPDTNFQGKGPNSGEITDIAIDPSGTIDEIIYIAAGSGGIWKTTDGGLNWSPKGDMLRTLSMGAVALDPTNREIVYAGTGNLFDPGRVFAKGVGIYKSIDGGETWAQLDGGVFATLFANSGINRILVANANVLLVATNKGLFHSIDGGLNFGDNFPFFNNGLPILHGEISSLSRDTLDPDIVYAAAAGYGVIRLKDEGATFDKNLFTGQFPPQFQAVFAGLPTSIYTANTTKGPFDRIAFGQSRRQQGQPDNKVMYASVQRGPTGPTAKYIGLFRSDDSGQSWAVMPDAKNRIDSDTVGGTPPQPNGANQTADNLTVGVDPQDPQSIYVCSKQLWFSPNAGANFLDQQVGTKLDTVASGEIHFDHHAMAFSPESHEVNTTPTRVYVGTDGGLATCKSLGANFWNNRNSGIGANLVRGIAIGRGVGGRDFTYCGMHDVGSAGHRPGDTNLEWLAALGGDSPVVAVDPADPQIVYGFTNENFAKTVDGGRLWATSDPGGGQPAIIEIKEASPDSPIVITTEDDHPFLNGDVVIVMAVQVNTAANHSAANPTWTVTRIDHRRFSLNGSVGIPGPVGTGGLVQSRDASIGRGLNNPTNDFVRRVALEQTSPDTHTRVVYVSEVDQLFKSTNAGIKFTLLTTPINKTITALATTTFDSNRLWVGLLDGSVHFSADGGTTWDVDSFKVSPGGVGPVDEIAVDPTNVARVAVVYSGQSGVNAAFRTRRCFLTSDNGKTWKDISGTDGAGPSSNLPDIPLHSVVWDTSTNPPSLIVASDAGVMRSTDLGASWHVLGANLPGVSCQSLAIDNSVTPPILRVGTYGRSCFELRKPTGGKLVVRSNLAFGTLLVGQSAELPVQLFNVGDTDLEVISLGFLTGSNMFDITPPLPLPFTLRVNEMRACLARYAPTVAGNHKVNFLVQTNDGVTPALKDIFASGSSVVASTPRLGANANLKFGTVSINADRTLPMQIINTGLGPLEIRNISRTAGSSNFDVIPAPTFPFTLQPGEKRDLTVRLKPSSSGPLNATFEIESNDPVIRNSKPAGTRTINATGVGKSPAGSNLALILILVGVAAVVGGVVLAKELRD